MKPGPLVEFSIQFARLSADCEADEVPAYSLSVDILDVIKLAAWLDRHHVRICNGYRRHVWKDSRWVDKWDKIAEAKDERAANRRAEKLRAILEPYGLLAYVQRDPRGLPVFIYREADSERLAVGDGDPRGYVPYVVVPIA